MFKKKHRPIERGDFVRVEIRTVNKQLSCRSEVLHIPQGPGDSWVFRDCHSDNIYHISEPCTVTLIDRKDTE